MNMNIYLAKVIIVIGEVRKNSTRLIAAPTPSVAIDYACYCESHTPEILEWDDNGVLDMHGELHYSASASKVSDDDLNVLKKYFHVHTVDFQQLHNSGDYPDYASLEDYKLAAYALLEKGFEFELDSFKEEVMIEAEFKQGTSIFDCVNAIAIHQSLKGK
ncbi:hypothetical protein EA007_00345 [Vibrio anguillarum]|uniref:hypothetical protein n=2 Tax=Vibrio anguillarum TaxID=55601 RepID=UPI00188B2FD0|nr:hypothetical protein [Vibrio anguillarum]MBF4249480.1 hypothetical protein [Vibrio anguillarum]